MDEQDFDSMTVVKDKNGISHADTEKIFSPEISAHELQKDLLGGMVMTKKTMGQITSRTRVIRNNFKRLLQN